jgi:hypothetical protein
MIKSQRRDKIFLTEFFQQKVWHGLVSKFWTNWTVKLYKNANLFANYGNNLSSAMDCGKDNIFTNLLIPEAKPIILLNQIPYYFNSTKVIFTLSVKAKTSRKSDINYIPTENT